MLGIIRTCWVFELEHTVRVRVRVRARVRMVLVLEVGLIPEGSRLVSRTNPLMLANPSRNPLTVTPNLNPPYSQPTFLLTD